MSALASALYEGVVQHRHHERGGHAFSYPITLAWIDLAELPALADVSRWFSVNRFNACHWRRSDYLGDPERDLETCVRDLVEQRSGKRPAGAIRMLTHPAHFGFCFNPVTFYYCYNQGEMLEAIVAEITNTPWRERHQYVFAHDGTAFDTFRFDKDFHVSPFLPMKLDYAWRFENPGEPLRVQKNVCDTSTRTFDATLSLRRQALSEKSLNRYIRRETLASIRVLWRIHWQALKLWLKKFPVYDHPKKDGTS